LGQKVDYERFFLKDSILKDSGLAKKLILKDSILKGSIDPPPRSDGATSERRICEM
jgi:hypothetical protein